MTFLTLVREVGSPGYWYNIHRGENKIAVYGCVCMYTLSFYWYTHIENTGVFVCLFLNPQNHR